MALAKYEDCIAAIETAEKVDDIAALKATLGELKTFFNARLGAKAAKDEKDGTGAVKRAIQGGRSWTPYAAKPTTPPAPSTGLL
jgi:hypothetical protein